MGGKMMQFSALHLDEIGLMLDGDFDALQFFEPAYNLFNKCSGILFIVIY